ncbi:MAG: A/G-specific adenine glycosylase [Flavobacteriaceae bacterium]
MNFSKVLIQWYLQNDRDLPWRATKTPYNIWLSEIILQQTRVAQGTPYYLKFIDEFPTVFDLANASEQQVLKLWQGLGYYSRARNLHFAAKQIVNDFQGVFPKTYKDIITLKGVGDYTASAISSICFHEPNAVVDGNVYRVLARYFDVSTPINSSKGIKEFKLLAQELIDQNSPGTYNQAVMEFGALHCKPQSPLCTTCPLASSCLAYQRKKIKILPVKEKKIKIKKRYLNYLVVMTAERTTILNERKGKGIWKGLYEFPLVESERLVDEKSIFDSEEFLKLFPKKSSLTLFNEKEIIHKLSHQHLYTRFWIVETTETLGNTISWNQIEDFPVPILISNFIKSFSLKTD